MNQNSPVEISQEARETHASAIVVDACGTRPQPWELQREAGVTALNITVTGSINHSSFGSNMPELVIQNITRTWAYVRANENDLMMVNSVTDIFRCKRENKIGLILHFQGIPWLPDISWIEVFIHIGVKVMMLTYNPGNGYASGCGEREDRGVSYIGRQVIREMNLHGALVDLAHVGHRSAMEAVEASTKPVAITHTGCYSLRATPRNAKDELMKSVAQSGGFIGMAVFSPLVGDASDHFPTLEDYFNHVEYAVNLVGPDHVGLGSDSLNLWRWRFFPMDVGKPPLPSVASGHAKTSLFWEAPLSFSRGI